VKRWSRGYTPILVEELDMELSSSALALLIRIRRESDQRETDGFVETRHIKRLAVTPGTRRKALTELEAARLIRLDQAGVWDQNFLQWCTSAQDRRAKRDKWLEAKRKGSRSTSDSKRDSDPESRVDSPTQQQQQAQQQHQTQQQQQELPADQEEAMPTQGAMIDLSNAWVRLSGKQPTSEDVDHFAWWIDQFDDRLSTSAIVNELERLFARQAKAGNPIAKAKYCDDAIRNLHETSAPRRREPEAMGEGEPEPVSENGRVSAERVQEAVRALAAKTGM
jgi:hypothetical protein